MDFILYAVPFFFVLIAVELLAEGRLTGLLPAGVLPSLD